MLPGKYAALPPSAHHPLLAAFRALARARGPSKNQLGEEEPLDLQTPTSSARCHVHALGKMMDASVVRCTRLVSHYHGPFRMDSLLFSPRLGVYFLSSPVLPRSNSSSPVVLLFSISGSHTATLIIFNASCSCFPSGTLGGCQAARQRAAANTREGAVVRFTVTSGRFARGGG